MAAKTKVSVWSKAGLDAASSTFDRLLWRMLTEQARELQGPSFAASDLGYLEMRFLGLVDKHASIVKNVEHIDCRYDFPTVDKILGLLESKGLVEVLGEKDFDRDADERYASLTAKGKEILSLWVAAHRRITRRTADMFRLIIDRQRFLRLLILCSQTKGARRYAQARDEQRFAVLKSEKRKLEKEVKRLKEMYESGGGEEPTTEYE